MDMFSLQGKVAVLSGASTGIGRHLAGTLAAAGAKVLLGARTVAKLDERVAEIRAAGGEAQAAPLDVSDLKSVIAFFDAAEKHFGGADILVNNAGVEAGAYTYVTLDDESWDPFEVFDRAMGSDSCRDPYPEFAEMRREAPVSKIDLRTGGQYLNCMRGPDGKDYWSTGVYTEIVEPERIVCTDSFADADGNVVPASHYGMTGDVPTEMLITVTFEDQGGKTRMTLRHEGLPAGEHQTGANQGWNEMFDKLAEYLRVAS